MLAFGTALIVLGGATWWWKSAPQVVTDSRLLGWRLGTEQLLPESGEQEMATTLALEAGTAHDEVADVGVGEFLVSVVCAGDDGSRVRVSLGGDDSGRGVRCSGARTPEVFSVGLTNQLRLRVNVDEVGPVVFRYTLQRMNG